jgi:hypothetical protein
MLAKSHAKEIPGRTAVEREKKPHVAILGKNLNTQQNGRTYSDVHDTPKGGRADGNGDGSSSIAGLGSTDETFCTVHGNAAHDVLSKMLSNLQDKLVAIVVNVKSVQNSGKVLAVEFD